VDLRDIQELRDWLQRRLSLNKEQFDVVWRTLEGEHIISDYADKYYSREKVLEEAKKWVRRYRAFLLATPSGARPSPPGRGSPGTTEPEITVDLGQRERMRTRVFARLAAETAEARPDVRKFRETALGGEVLTDEQASALLEGEVGPDGNAPNLEELRRLGELLTRAYPWRHGDAVWFLLTGHVPPVFPLRAVGSITQSAHGPEWATVTLTVEPWVQAKDVTRLYRKLQRQMLGKDNRLIGEKTLRLLEFVQEQKKTNNGGMRVWMQRWNEAYLSWQYTARDPEQAVRNFHTAYKDTYERVMYPAYNPPNWRPYEPTPWQRWRDEQRRQNRAKAIEKVESIPVRKRTRS
jgi:hypothetical protein